MHAILGAKFLDLFNGVDTDRVHAEWAAALADFKPIELDRGLFEITNRKYSALTLGEFKNFCRPCLDPEWAYREAEKCLRQRDIGQAGDWSHPAVWRAASTLSTEVRAGNYKACSTRWAFTLKDELSNGWGEMPPPPRPMLPNSTRVRPPNEEERRKIRAMLGKGDGDA